GLSYLTDWRVLVVAEPLDERSLATAVDAARYNGASLVVVVGEGAGGPSGLPESATVLEMPSEDDGAFPALVGRYAALLDAGRRHDDAWHEALAGSGWESAAE
ncbi:MAG: hypothetical protein M3N29_05545, partial [Chloroflexota bacterium]|nr:hypothetical protein [Chloroflexota bacterium]